MAKEKQYTEQLKCGHCENKVIMEVVSDYVKTHTYDAPGYPESYEHFQTLLCPACQGMSYGTTFWADYMDPTDCSTKILFPVGERSVNGLPPAVEAAYRAAQKVRAIDANSYGMLLGRLLEKICLEQGAQGHSLDDKLRDLIAKQAIPDRLAKVAANLRQLRNVGAHVDLGELTVQELPVLDDLIRALLDYVYTAPYLAEVAEKRLAGLKSKAKAKKAVKKVARKVAKKTSSNIAAPA